jgi:hypothetical protein
MNTDILFVSSVPIGVHPWLNIILPLRSFRANTSGIQTGFIYFPSIYPVYLVNPVKNVFRRRCAGPVCEYACFPRLFPVPEAVLALGKTSVELRGAPSTTLSVSGLRGKIRGRHFPGTTPRAIGTGSLCFLCLALHWVRTLLWEHTAHCGGETKISLPAPIRQATEISLFGCLLAVIILCLCRGVGGFNP